MANEKIYVGETGAKELYRKVKALIPTEVPGNGKLKVQIGNAQSVETGFTANTDTDHTLVIGSASTSAQGVVQLSNAIDSVSETNAATSKAVKDAYDALDAKMKARAVFFGSVEEWNAYTTEHPEGDPSKVYYVQTGSGEDKYTVYVWKVVPDGVSFYEETDESSISLEGYWHDSPTVVDDPTDTDTFVSGIALNQNGTVSVTRKAVQNATASVSGVGGHHGLMTATDKEKLDGIEAGAQVNVKSDWTAAAGSASEILHKPGEYAGSDAGLVPHGTQYDQTKFLRGDGSWANLVNINRVIYGETTYDQVMDMLDVGEPIICIMPSDTDVPYYNRSYGTITQGSTLVYTGQDYDGFHFGHEISHSTSSGNPPVTLYTEATLSSQDVWSLKLRNAFQIAGLNVNNDSADISITPWMSTTAALTINGGSTGETAKRYMLLPTSVTSSPGRVANMNFVGFDTMSGMTPCMTALLNFAGMTVAGVEYPYQTVQTQRLYVSNSSGDAGLASLDFTVNNASSSYTLRVGTEYMAITKPYDRTKTYTEGDFCITKDGLWRLDTPYTPPANFTQANWEKVTIIDLLAEKLSGVAHDSSLTGDGTANSPLSVVGGGDSWKQWSIDHDSSGTSDSVYIGKNNSLTALDSIVVGHSNSIIGTSEVSVYGYHNTLTNSNQNLFVTGRYNTLDRIIQGVIVGSENKFTGVSNNSQIVVVGNSNTGVGTTSGGLPTAGTAYQAAIIGMLNKTTDVDLAASFGYNNSLSHSRQCAVFGYSNDVSIYDYSSQAQTTENIVVGTYATVRGYRDAVLSSYGSVVGDRNAIVTVYGRVGKTGQTGDAGNANENLGFIGQSGTIEARSSWNFAMCEYHTITGSNNRVISAYGHTTGNDNIDIGLANEINGTLSMTIGEHNTVTSAYNAFIFGHANTSSYGNSTGTQISIGRLNTVSSSTLAINIGQENTIQYGSSITVGQNNTAQNGNNVVIGFDNRAEYGSFVIGNSIQRGNTSGTYFAFGNNLIANYNQVVLGYYNEAIGGYSSNATLIVGCGTDADHRANAMVVYNDGTVKAKRFVSDDPDMTLTAGNGIEIATNVSAETITISSKIPAPPTTNGTYMLKCEVSDGVTTYSWITE